MAWYEEFENKNSHRKRKASGKDSVSSSGKRASSDSVSERDGASGPEGASSYAKHKTSGKKSASSDRFSTRSERPYRSDSHDHKHFENSHDDHDRKNRKYTSERHPTDYNPAKPGRQNRSGRSEYSKASSGDPRSRDTYRRTKKPDSKPDRGTRTYSNKTSKNTAPKYLDYEYIPKKPATPVAKPDEHEPEYIISGRNPVREALKSGRDLEKLMIQRGELSGSAGELARVAREAHIPVQYVEKQALDALASHHQGVVAVASAYKYAELGDILSAARAKQEEPFLILLDGITDPHNLGAVIRTAECAGAHGVIIPEHRSVGLTPAAVKASAGAVEHIPVVRVPNLHRTIADLKALNIWSYAVTMDGDDYRKPDYRGGVALVIGAEGDGLSRLTRDLCDFSVALPVLGHIDSLNASVAAGIIMYHVLSRRGR